MTELETMVARLYARRKVAQDAKAAKRAAWLDRRVEPSDCRRAIDAYHKAANLSGAALRAVLREGKQLVAQMAIDRERETKGTG